MKNNRAARTAVIIAALAATGMGLGGCSVIQGILGEETVSRDADSQEVVEAGTADVFNLRVGDCFDDESLDGGVSEVPAVPCAEPHDNEIYFIYDLPDGDFPGVTEVETLADEGCAAQFEAFVGAAYETSAIDYWALYPSEDTWTQIGDREVICSVWEPGVKVTGTLAGVAR